jgi:hypothetical protein
MWNAVMLAAVGVLVGAAWMGGYAAWRVGEASTKLESGALKYSSSWHGWQGMRSSDDATASIALVQSSREGLWLPPHCTKLLAAVSQQWAADPILLLTPSSFLDGTSASLPPLSLPSVLLRAPVTPGVHLPSERAGVATDVDASEVEFEVPSAPARWPGLGSWDGRASFFVGPGGEALHVAARGGVAKSFVMLVAFAIFAVAATVAARDLLLDAAHLGPDHSPDATAVEDAIAEMQRLERERQSLLAAQAARRDHGDTPLRRRNV